MANNKIDYDLGVIINIHKNTGMDVFMYVDEPGVYLNAHGDKVAQEIAAEAGYDVEKYSKARVKMDRKKQALAMIDAELADEKDVVEVALAERNGYKVVSTGLGRHHVVDPDGNRLTTFPVSLDIAQKLFDGMAGEAKAEEKPVVVGKSSGLKKA
jgi:hypothetical protein